MTEQASSDDRSTTFSGPTTIFWHVDDIGWTEVQRQQNADDSVSVVREKWPIIRPDFLSAHVHYESGMVVRRHGHRSNHVVFVLGGSGWIGGEPCRPGTHIHVPLGAAFGPIVAGPEGLTCWELSFGEFGGWGDRPELYANEIAERGITPLPDPPLEIGDWFVDPRGDWGGERPSPKVEGMESVLLHLDDLDWNDGGPGVRRKTPIEQPDFTSQIIELGSDATIAASVDRGHHLVWVIAGGVHVAGRWCQAGTHIEVQPGSSFGPIVAGAAGATYLELIDLAV